MWNVELTGANFNGRIVQEEFGGSVDDSCWFPGSSIASQAGSGMNTQWLVRSDNTLTGHGPYAGNDGDWVGWLEDSVSYYRGVTGPEYRAPCDYNLTQNMKINRPGSSEVVYRSGNVLWGGIDQFTVWSIRAGPFAARNW
jgi:hypothetical protein